MSVFKNTETPLSSVSKGSDVIENIFLEQSRISNYFKINSTSILEKQFKGIHDAPGGPITTKSPDAT